MDKTKVKAWYFSNYTRRLRYGDGREIAIGVTHTVDGEIAPCQNGLHGSERILDALGYAPGLVVWRVELSGTIVANEDDDKLAASERTYLAGGVDITELLRAFARRQALRAAHLWDMPDAVRQYLETGDEALRDEAAGEAAANAYATNAAYAAYAAANAATNAATNAAAYAADNAAAYAATNAAAYAARALGVSTDEANAELEALVLAAIAGTECD